MEKIKKYTCSAKNKSDDLICNREFDEEEYQITRDKNKCILHGDKSSWHKEQDK